jgi:hypothetical protein
MLLSTVLWTLLQQYPSASGQRSTVSPKDVRAGFLQPCQTSWTHLSRRAQSFDRAMVTMIQGQTCLVFAALPVLLEWVDGAILGVHALIA